MADGRLDARVIAGYKIWDVAAAALIAREAGSAFINLEDGKPADTDTSVAILGNEGTISTIRRQIVVDAKNVK